MRRVVTLFLALGLLTAVSLAPAAAREDRFEILVVGHEVPVGISADGATLTAGTFELLIGGVVVETGTVEGRYYDRGPALGVKGMRHFVDASTGNEVDTIVKGRVVDVDESGTVFTYVFEETITSSDDGATGHGRGVAVLTLVGEGFDLHTSAAFIIDPPS